MLSKTHMMSKSVYMGELCQKIPSLQHVALKSLRCCRRCHLNRLHACDIYLCQCELAVFLCQLLQFLGIGRCSCGSNNAVALFKELPDILHHNADVLKITFTANLGVNAGNRHEL